MDEGLEVLYEDAWTLVVDKPPGLLSHPVTIGEDSLSARVHAYLGDSGAPVHLVGRLDRDTSGVVLIAKEARTKRRLEARRHRDGFRRTYIAVVDGRPDPEAGLIDAPIGRNPDDPPLRAVRGEGAPARTRYRTLEVYGGASLLELEMDTGRTHQIRVHLQHIGHSVLGDRWYGGWRLDLIERQALHASSVSFRHPETGHPVTVSAPLPADMEALIDRLRQAD